MSIHELFDKKNIIPQANHERTNEEEIDKTVSDAFVNQIADFYKNWIIIKLIIKRFMWFSIRKEGNLQLKMAAISLKHGLTSNFHLKY